MALLDNTFHDDGSLSSKKIITKQIRLDQLDFSFGNPRKIKGDKKEELRKSLKTHGDFSSLVVDEQLRVISGNQRAGILLEEDPDATCTCKVLCGYSESELRQINVLSNTHAGEWDLDVLADWFGDLSFNIDSEEQTHMPSSPTLEKALAPLPHERYNYVLLVCRTDTDFLALCEKLNISGKKVVFPDRKNKKLKARAVFYDGQF